MYTYAYWKGHWSPIIRSHMGPCVSIDECIREIHLRVPADAHSVNIYRDQEWVASIISRPHQGFE